ncbi:hypothetical protein [Pseudomonas sp. BN417]|uniref:hypothetical protein n=1 Tax=Pseudomonas sp. BN417 TaxID=2567890 RepID=UPI002458F13D|nr:hypothetical protein [Pseudomonas sp. BN417]
MLIQQGQVAVITGAAGGIGKGLAREVFAGIEAGRFWLLPHNNFKPALERRLASILDETNPVFQMADA